MDSLPLFRSQKTAKLEHVVRVNVLCTSDVTCETPGDGESRADFHPAGENFKFWIFTRLIYTDS